MEQYVINEAQYRGYEIQNVRGNVCDLLDMETGMLWKDAPLEDARRYIMERLDNEAVCLSVLMDGIAFDRYNVIGNLWYKEKPVLLMQSKKSDYLPWCVQYGGSGQYFRDFESMMAYAFIRFCGDLLTPNQYKILRDMCQDHRKNGTPIRWNDWERVAH